MFIQHLQYVIHCEASRDLDRESAVLREDENRYLVF